MNVGITGASGFIARHLIPRLRARGHQVFAFSRSPGKPVSGCVETRAFLPDHPVDVSGLDAVINLTGELVMGRWTEAKKARIVTSRVLTTTRLVEAMGQLPDGPRILISGSATGFYGDRGEETLTETSAPGDDFLAHTCRRWENAALEAERFGTRVALVRTGLVCGRESGLFPLLSRVFKLGLGGRLGSGRQWMSAIHVADEADLFIFLLESGDPAARGPFNAVCPEPVRNADFTRVLARALGRPAFLPVPAFVLRAVLGESSQLPLGSVRALPARAQEMGFAFRFPTVATIFDDLA